MFHKENLKGWVAEQNYRTAQVCDARDDDSSTKADSIKINYTCIMNPQVKKAAPIILVFALAALVFIIRQCKHER